jgi:hypothetical protein
MFFSLHSTRDTPVLRLRSDVALAKVGVNPFESGRMKLADEFAVGFFG